MKLRLTKKLAHTLIQQYFMKRKERQYIVTINSEYVRYLYGHQTGNKVSQDEILCEVIKDIDDFLEGKTKRIIRFLLPDGSHSFTITSLVQHNLQERRKAKRRKR